LTRNDLAVSIGFGVILFMVLFVALIQVLAVFLSATTLADARFDQLAAIGIFTFAMTAGVFWCVGIGKRERLRIGPSEIRVARSWMGIPWRQTTVAVENISQIKLLPNADADGLVSAIALDAKGQNMLFGKDLSLIEANGVVDEMVKIAPELGRVTRGFQPPAP
jgi:hypothetical protein